MKKVLVLLLCAVMVLGVTACGEEEKQDAVRTPVSSTSTTSTTIPSGPVAYAHNEIINRFFVRFVRAHKDLHMDKDTIRRGKDLSEYVATINECAVTVTDVSNKVYPSGNTFALQIDILGNVTDTAQDKLLAALVNIAVAADTECTKADADQAAAMLETLTVPLAKAEWVSKNLQIAYYSPVIKNEYTTQPCRISLLVKDPLVTVTTTSAGGTTTTTAK